LSERCECIRNAIVQSEDQHQVREQLRSVFKEIELPLRKKTALAEQNSRILKDGACYT
jgi:hypothetical protein